MKKIYPLIAIMFIVLMSINVSAVADLKVYSIEGPTTVYTNQEFYVFTIVRNTGDLQDSFSATLYIDGVRINTSTFEMGETPSLLSMPNNHWPKYAIPRDNEGVAMFKTSISSNGTHTITITVSPIGDTDPDMTNNEVSRTINVVNPPIVDVSVPSYINMGGSSIDQGETVKTSFTVTNNGTVPITIDVNTNIDSKFYPGVSYNNKYLNPGEQTSVNVTLTVPSDYYGRNSVGTIVVTANGNGQEKTRTITVYLEAKEKREAFTIQDMDIYVDDDHTDIDEEEEVEVKPDSHIDLEVEVENTLGDDLRDVYVRVRNDDLDIDEESNEKDIDDGDSYRFKVSFDIPTDADEDDYLLEITIKGRDRDGEYYRKETNITLQVEKKTHDVKILSIDTSNGVCGEYTNIYVKVANLGSRDESNAKVKLLIKDFNVEVIRTIAIDEGDTQLLTYSIRIPPGMEGTAIVEVYTYDSYFSENDYGSAILSFTCQQEQEQEQQEDSGMEIKQSNQYNGTIITGEKDESLMVIGMGVIALLLLVLIIVILATNTSKTKTIENKKPQRKKRK